MSADASAADRPRWASLEACYALLMRAYPAGYRDAHGAEILGTLMEASASGRWIPSLRETVGLVTGGFAVRARRAAESRVSWWADGLHLGVCVLAVVNLTYAFADFTDGADSYWGWVAGSVLLVLALLRGRVRVALPLALAAAFGVSRSMIFGGGEVDWVPVYGPAYGNWVSLTPYGLLVAGVIVLAARRSRRLRARSWWWLAIPVAALASVRLAGVDESSEVWALARVGLEAGLLLAGVWATAIARSRRWVLAAAMYVLPGEVSAVGHLSLQSRGLMGYWAVLAALLLAMAATAYRVRART